MDGIRFESPARSDLAYVTLVTNEAYLPGARALLRSLAATGTAADYVAMLTGAVSEGAAALLRAEGARIAWIDLLPVSDGFVAAHAKDQIHGRNPFTKGEKPVFHTPLDNFAKLRLWQMTDYRRVVFLDADAVVLRNCDRLFDYPEFSAAPNVYESLVDFHRLNSGVFVAQPDAGRFADMMGALDQPGAFWKRTDQTFLEHYFPDWHGLPVFFNMLQYVWMNLPALWDWRAIYVLHYQYEKPWSDHAKTAQLAGPIAAWQHFAGEGPVTPFDPAAMPAPSGA